MSRKDRLLVTTAGAALLALWVWMTFVSSQSAPFGVKLIGTTSTVLVVGLLLVLVWEEGLDRREAQERSVFKRVRRESIPGALQDRVWVRDDGRCRWVEHGERCPRRENLEFDHIQPVSKGGKNTYRNLQLLCQEHNRFKGARDHEPPGDTLADIPARPPG